MEDFDVDGVDVPHESRTVDDNSGPPGDVFVDGLKMLLV